MRLLLVAIFGLLLTTSVLCQNKPTINQIAVVDTEALFDEKAGLRDLSSLVKPLELEFAGLNSELRSLGKEYDDLADSISKISKAAEKYPGVDWIGDDFMSKADRLKQLECTIKSKQEVAHQRYLKRRGEVTKDISPKIAEALRQFTAERGYLMVLDRSKVDEGAVIEKPTGVELSDITSSFVKYYNERFSGPQSK